MRSERTNKLKRKKRLVSLLHFLCMFGPLIYFVSSAYLSGTTTTVDKVTLTLSMVVGAVLAIISLMLDIKYKAGLHKTILYVVLLALVAVLTEQVKTIIVILAITGIIDELVLSPLHNRFVRLCEINVEIDRRS